MSINLGTDAVTAARELRTSEYWGAIREGIFEAARRQMNLALETAGERAGDAIGYARALRDVWQALEAATHGVTPNRVEKPASVGKNYNRAGHELR